MYKYMPCMPFCHCRLKFKDEMNKRQEMEELLQQYVRGDFIVQCH